MIINRKIIIISAAVIAGLAILAIGGIMLLNNNQTTNSTDTPAATDSPSETTSPFELTLAIAPTADIKIISATLKNISAEPRSYQSYYQPELKIIDSTGKEVPIVPPGLLVQTISRPPKKEDFKTLQPGETSSWSYMIELVKANGMDLSQFTPDPVQYQIKAQDDTIYLLKTGEKYQVSVKWNSANVWHDTTGTGGYDAIIPAKSHVVPDAWAGTLEAKGLEFEL